MSSPIASSPKLEQLAAGDPELRPYAELLGAALEAAREPLWAKAIAGLDASALARLHAGEPALHGAPLLLPRAAAEALFSRLTAQLPSPAALGEGTLSADLLARALTLDTLEGPQATVLQLTLLPLLHAAGKACAAVVADAAWTSGVCPVCAAWPALAESRGIERLRVLRCGRCGSEWKLPWQLCPFCVNGDHASLTYLYSEQIGEARRVFTCDRCQGYLKTLATLSAIDPLAVPIEDLATLELDLAAVDAGFKRPNEAGFDLDVRLRWDA